jgi:hypothetical protein
LQPNKIRKVLQLSKKFKDNDELSGEEQLSNLKVPSVALH